MRPSAPRDPGGPVVSVRISRASARVLAFPIQAWRQVSSVLPPRCRFYPSCSTYAIEALEGHGPIRGSWLAVRRVARCHPWHEGGVDPVPVARTREPVARGANVRSDARQTVTV